MIFKLGELFCGPGGIALGASEAQIFGDKDESFSIQHAWASDYDRDTCLTFRKNIYGASKETVIHKDIKNLDFEVLKKISEIDALAFGFPCNDFSMVGEQKGMNGVFGPLYSYGVQALQKFKPMWFLAENVGGLRNSNEGNAFQKILYDLDDAGYNVTPHLYKFEEYGVPQARHRIIIVGIRKDIRKIFKIPSPMPYKGIDNTAKTAIEVPPIPFEAYNNERTNHAEVVIERLKYIKPGENAFNADLPASLKLNVKGAQISQIYRRLSADKPSYTITGSGGGGTHVYHWSEDRALTNRERARLQTFPDHFIFSGSKESVRKQIGMAVPPKGVKIIFEAILKTFADVDYEAVKQNIELERQYQYEANLG